MIEGCIADISSLRAIPPQRADLYASAMEQMIDRVDLELEGQLA